MAVAVLPPELLSLVHHVELNKSGWWDKALQQVILAAMWLTDESLTPQGVAAAISDSFSVNLGPEKIAGQIDILCETNTLVRLPDGSIKISEQSFNELQQGLVIADENASQVKKLFIEHVERACPSIESEQCWQRFNAECLAPLVQELGARTYELVFGMTFDMESSISSSQLSRLYPPELGQQLRSAFIKFLVPKNAAVRSYVLGYLNAYFFLEATNLRNETLQELSERIDKKLTFTIFLDTNFLFSILDLHENPANETAFLLLKVLRTVSQHVATKLYVFRLTVEEAQRVLFAFRETLKGTTLTPNLAESVVESGLSGIPLKFAQACAASGGPIDPESYFNPYLTDFNAILRGKGIELYNEKVDHHLTKQEVIDDIIELLDSEAPPTAERDRRYKALEHDMVLWHFVRDKRLIHIDSPLQANFWVVTIDNKFLNNDQFKTRKTSDTIPVCINPTTLIQMLQSWVPRTPEFEEAMLASLRLPFLFQEFDTASEQVTIRILKALSRFENVGDLSTDTIAHVLMNDAVRQRLASEEDPEKRFDAVRDSVFAQEQEIRVHLDEAQRESHDLRTQIGEQVQTSKSAQEQLTEQIQKAQELKRQLEEERNSRGTLETQLNKLQVKLQQYEAQQVARQFRRNWVIFPLTGALVLAVSLGLVVSALTVLKPFEAILIVVVFGLFLWLEIVHRMGSRSSVINKSVAFSRIQKIKGWLYVGLAAVAIGVISNAIWDWIGTIF